MDEITFIEAWWHNPDDNFLAFHVMEDEEWIGNIEKFRGEWSFTTAIEASGW